MENEKGSIAVRAMQDMIRFLSLAEKDWDDAAKEWRAHGEDSAADIFDAKSDAMYYARRKAEYLLSWIVQEESED